MLRDANGIPIGMANNNPLMDTCINRAKYLDGHKVLVAANAIAQNLFAQVDEDGNRYVLLDSIDNYGTNN